MKYGVTYNMMSIPKNEEMPWNGMTRDWLAACYAGSLCAVFGVLWLWKDLILWAFIIQFVFLPSWTSAEIYNRYNRVDGNVFTTWWYASVVFYQFFLGLATMYLYAYLKAEMEARAREEEIKMFTGKMVYPRETASITAYPCKCKLWDAQKDQVMKRYDNLHQIDIRANILCPKCKERIDVILQ